MLHSVSLAPGEATRVAVIDWSRRASAFAAETIGETEQLDSATTPACAQRSAIGSRRGHAIGRIAIEQFRLVSK